MTTLILTSHLRPRASALRRRNSTLGLRPSRDGVALPLALFSIVLISVLISGAAFATTQSYRVGRNALTQVRASEAAEFGAAAVARDWDTEYNVSAAAGATLPPDTIRLAGGAETATRLTRLTPSLWWVESHARAGPNERRADAFEALGVIYRLAIPDLPARATFTVRDTLEVLGAAEVSGNDTTASLGTPVLACVLAATPIAAAAGPDTTILCDGPCGTAPAGRLKGTPLRVVDTLASDTARYRAFGDESWQTLAAHAHIVLAGAATITAAPAILAGACDTSRQDNWGEPLGAGPCSSYLPIVWAQGDLHIAGGRGQGIILADGDVTLSAMARFHGVIIARDDIVVSPTGATVLGLALANDERTAAGDHPRVDGPSIVRYSRCALDRALLGSAKLVRVKQRSWARLF
jgi:hypothetical protein